MDALLFDTHAHLDDEQFDPAVGAVVARAQAAGVTDILTVGTTRATSERCLTIAGSHEGVHAAVGIHPNHAAEAAPGDWDAVVQLARQPRVVAVGETGLDRFRHYTPLDVQQDYFVRHLHLAQDLGLPVIIHMRACTDDVLVSLREARQRGPLRGVMHAYSADAATAAECLQLGLHISFAGNVTYKNATALRAVAREIPGDRLLLETDSPYLSPEPCRGQRPNEPGLVVHTAMCLAALRGQTVAELAAQTSANARRLFVRPS
jgi:TatD DNase family protein